MFFTVEPAIFERFPGMRIPVAVARGLNNAVAPDGVTELWRAAWRGAASAAAYGNAQSHPRIVPWRERFRAMGVSGKEFPSSAEALLRRSLKGGEPFTINPLVDFYNAISLQHVCPAGGFDLAEITGLQLRLTHAGDTFHGLDAAEPLALPPGEVAYTDGATVLTRHFVWRQAREALVTPATRDVILLSEVLGEVGNATAEAVLNDFRDGLATHFGVDARTFIVSEEQPRVVW
jgi:DNA/RNA-binding domain of Phe-tRNA-synthetase-like protein